MDFSTGRVELELLLYSESFAGYHFGALIKTPTLFAGFVYDLTFEPGYEDGVTRLYVGMPVVAAQGDSVAPIVIAGTVTALTPSVRVDFVSAPSFVGDWVLRAAPAASFAATAEGAKLVFVADSAAGIVHSSGRTRARVFA